MRPKSIEGQICPRIRRPWGAREGHHKSCDNCRASDALPEKTRPLRPKDARRFSRLFGITPHQIGDCQPGRQPVGMPPRCGAVSRPRYAACATVREAVAQRVGYSRVRPRATRSSGDPRSPYSRSLGGSPKPYCIWSFLLFWTFSVVSVSSVADRIPWQATRDHREGRFRRCGEVPPHCGVGLPTVAQLRERRPAQVTACSTHQRARNAGSSCLAAGSALTRLAKSPRLPPALFGAFLALSTREHRDETDSVLHRAPACRGFACGRGRTTSAGDGKR